MNLEEAKKFKKKHGPQKLDAFMTMYESVSGVHKVKFMSYRLKIPDRTIYDWIYKIYNEKLRD
jgi:hypothetical protein